MNATKQTTPSRKRRLACMLYEGVLLFGVLFLTAYLFDTLTQSRHALHLRGSRQLCLLAVTALYFSWFWRHGGQTLAMKTWRIRLVHRDTTTPLSWGHCLWRFALGVFCTLTGLGFLYSFCNAEQTWLQDQLGKTKMLLTHPNPKPGSAGR